MKRLINRLGVAILCLVWLPHILADGLNSRFINKTNELVNIEVTFLDNSSKSFQIGAKASQDVTLSTCVKTIKIVQVKHPHVYTTDRTECPSDVIQESFSIHRLPLIKRFYIMKKQIKQKKKQQVARPEWRWET